MNPRISVSGGDSRRQFSTFHEQCPNKKILMNLGSTRDKKMFWFCQILNRVFVDISAIIDKECSMLPFSDLGQKGRPFL